MSNATPITAEDKKVLAEGAEQMAEFAKSEPGKLGAIKTALWRYLGGAFVDEKDGSKVVSLGRLAFVAWYVQAAIKWQTMAPDVDLHSSMLTVGVSLLGFVTASKVVSAVKGRQG